MLQPTVLLGRLSLPERGYIRERLRDETFGGILLLVAAAIALVWANAPWGSSYQSFVNFEFGPNFWHLHLSVAQWASDGLLAVFFFVIGLELKHELVLGSLSNVRKAAVPVAAAIGGMLVPAVIFVIINISAPQGVPGGWGTPMATDIAFALAVLAVVGKNLPIALRAFLLTLAVVDDLGAILVIAVFYTDKIALSWLALSVLCCVAYAIAQRQRVRTAWLYVPLGLLTWVFMLNSGVHATVAGVALGLLTRVRLDPGETQSPADRVAHRIHPLSAGICVPLFALVAAGVDVRSIGVWTSISSPVAIGVILGLVIGKPIGIFCTSWLVARFTKASLSSSLRWLDIFAVGLLGGIGFTVALLIAELSFTGTDLSSAKLAVLVASVAAAILAAIALRRRGRAYAALAELEEVDQ
ncbi:MAG: Na+/H+ antiporter NhaA [Candidatus Nanopelagicales bacterium]|nr:Na+/H+ antiporter NhaA [Candidatus Nanopelagicales bacterium]